MVYYSIDPAKHMTDELNCISSPVYNEFADPLLEGINFCTDFKPVIISLIACIQLVSQCHNHSFYNWIILDIRPLHICLVKIKKEIIHQHP